MRARLLSVAAILCLGILIGSVIGPAGAHVTGNFGHLWKKHIAKKLADAGYMRGYEVIQQAHTLPPDQQSLFEIPCPAGKKVLGGGWAVFGSGSPYHDAPNNERTAWSVSIDNTGGGEALMNGWAICAKVN